MSTPDEPYRPSGPPVTGLPPQSPVGPGPTPPVPSGAPRPASPASAAPTPPPPVVAHPSPAPAGASRPPASPADPPSASSVPRPQPSASKPETARTPPVQVGTNLKTKKRARLVIKRVDPWSVLKFSLLFSICLLIVFVVAVTALYFALDSLGVFDSINKALLDLTDSGGEDGGTGGVEVVFSGPRIIGGATVIGLINVIIITAISTLAAFLYNLCSDIVGGIEVTLAERE